MPCSGHPRKRARREPRRVDGRDKPTAVRFSELDCKPYAETSLRMPRSEAGKLLQTLKGAPQI
jgi:hypothetical protein